MSDEKSFKDEIRARKRAAGIIVIALLLIGAVIALFGAIQSGVITGIASEDHMTDPTIPYNELENATFTIDAEWVKEKQQEALYIVILGALLVAPGYVGLILVDALAGDKRMHQEFCKGAGEQKYCSECGLKLSRLKKE